MSIHVRKKHYPWLFAHPQRGIFKPMYLSTFGVQDLLSTTLSPQCERCPGPRRPSQDFIKLVENLQRIASTHAMRL